MSSWRQPRESRTETSFDEWSTGMSSVERADDMWDTQVRAVSRTFWEYEHEDGRILESNGCYLKSQRQRKPFCLTNNLAYLVIMVVLPVVVLLDVMSHSSQLPERSLLMTPRSMCVSVFIKNRRISMSKFAVTTNDGWWHFCVLKYNVFEKHVM